MAEGDRGLLLVEPSPRRADDGSAYQAPGVSILHYAGDRRFDYELDILNMTEVGEIMRDSGWKPSRDFNMPR